MYATTFSKSPKGLEDFRFEKTSVATFNDGIRVSWAWFHKPTEDWGTKFGTKAQAVKSARRFRRAMRAEGLIR